MTNNDDKYTDPELRTEIKERIQEGDKGGQPGQWSARKAQMMGQEYKKEMHARGEEPYTTDKSEQSESQKHLSEWTNEDWQTSDGNGNAKQEDGTEKRYLPKKAWENMSEEEKQETDAKKAEGSKEGKQFVPNTEAAKNARKNAQERSEEKTTENGDEKVKEGDNHVQDGEKDGQSTSRGTKKKRTNGEEEYEDESAIEDKNEENKEEEEEPAAKAAKTNEGSKRKTRSSMRKDKSTENGAEKEKAEGAEKSNGKAANADDKHGQPGSKDRLPNEGQKVHWKAGAWAEGTAVKILRTETEYEGLHAKASEDDPRIVVKSAKNGKHAVHKPDKVFW